MLQLIWPRWLVGVSVSLVLCWLLGHAALQVLALLLPPLDALLWAQFCQLCWLLLSGVLLQSRLDGWQLWRVATGLACALMLADLATGALVSGGVQQ